MLSTPPLTGQTASDAASANAASASVRTMASFAAIAARILTDLDRLCSRRVRAEEFRRREPAEPRDEDAGERLHPDVVDLDGAVVVVARVGDLVLGIRQLGLQFRVALVRLQLRILLGDRENRSERTAQV